MLSMQPQTGRRRGASLSFGSSLSFLYQVIYFSFESLVCSKERLVRDPPAESVKRVCPHFGALRAGPRLWGELIPWGKNNAPVGLKLTLHS